MITRRHHLGRLLEAIRRYPVVAIVGSRQVGKTTLARQVAERHGEPVTFFDLESPEDLARLAEPMMALKRLSGLIVLDEIQRVPEIFPVLRVLADRPESPANFLILGSASPELLRQSSDSLAGRILYHELSGFGLDEVGVESWRQLWLRGGFPRSFLAASTSDSAEWRRSFVRTFLERDLPQLGIRIESETLRRFWTMLAHYHGQIWNGAELARAFGVSASTVKRYLDTLTHALVVHQLPPWFENLVKRQVKSSKVYLNDSGLLHTLLNLESELEVTGHPKVGASFEGFAMSEVLRRLGARRYESFFWATQSGAELDLLVVRGLRRRGFEFKHTSTPRLTRSMRVALDDLRLDSLEIIYPGEHTFPLGERARAIPLRRLANDLEPL